MKIFRRFMTFCLRGGLALSAFSAIGVALGKILTPENLVPLFIMTPIAAVWGFIFGFISSAIGFSILFPFRKDPQTLETLAILLGFVLGSICIWIASFRISPIGDLRLRLLFFPVLPWILAIIYFRRLARIHIQTL